jgi:RNA polymerase sigma-70 factor (ECF subfamily)
MLKAAPRLAPPDTDAALVLALQKGRPGAAAAFFDAFEPKVQHVIVRVLGLDPDVPDLVHDVFLIAFESIRKLREPAAARGWLEGIAVHVARAHLRRRRRRGWLGFLHLGPAREEAAPPPNPEVSEAMKAFYGVLEGMPVDERVAFAFRFIDEMPVPAVARLCGISLRTAHRRLARAERRFVEAATGHPVLGSWIRPHSRWAKPTTTPTKPTTTPEGES